MRQSVEFTSNAPSNMKAGNTWYAPACMGAMTTASAHAAGASFNQALRQGLIAGGTAMAFNGAGDIYQANEFMGYVAHAGVGCVSSVAGGGSCGQGATSAVFGKYTMVSIGGTPGHFNAYQFTATVIAGGVGSVIAGGKFKNGAETAAFGYLFNWMTHRSRLGAIEERLRIALAKLAPDEIPPGVDVNANIARSQSMSGLEFYDAVKTGGEWDYKQDDPKYENFGNFNFGATCGSQALFLCAPGAGAYQIYSGTSEWSYWKSFFDAPP